METQEDIKEQRISSAKETPKISLQFIIEEISRRIEKAKNDPEGARKVREELGRELTAFDWTTLKVELIALWMNHLEHSGQGIEKLRLTHQNGSNTKIDPMTGEVVDEEEAMLL